MGVKRGVSGWPGKRVGEKRKKLRGGGDNRRFAKTQTGIVRVQGSSGKKKTDEGGIEGGRGRVEVCLRREQF